ncbi:MAG: adenylate/guanylate cyclase domain-containing protein, partial [Proteobacteria bacterium]|nr:adenylate/guanylate cyclase domain-containing protein [Pseudomonadota bacterium]
VDFSNRMMDDDSSTEIVSICNTFKNVMRSTELGSYLVRDISMVDIKNKGLIQFMKGHLDQFKCVDGVHIGTESGYFILLKRVLPGSEYRGGAKKFLPKKAAFAVRIVDRTTTKITEIWYYLDEFGNKLDEEEIPESQITYVYKNRPWYQKTVQSLSNTWTDVFFGETDKKATTACAVPLFSGDGELVGVISSSVRLSEMSRGFVSYSGISMIINQKGEVIAHPTEKKFSKIIDGEHKLITLDDLQDKIASVAFHVRAQQAEKKCFSFKFNGIEYIALFKKIKTEGVADWDYLMLAPIDNFIGGVKVAQRNTLMICLIILILSIIVIVFISKRISTPINNLSKQADRITNFDLGAVDGVKSGIKEIQKLQDSISRMRKSLISFAKFVPKNLVKKLLDKGIEVKIGGTKKQLTIFFSDIANFTAISETYPAEKLVLHLSEYFEEITEILKQNDATIDKYIDDTVMAFWGAPQYDANHALHCCVSALLCQRRLLDLNRKWEYEKKPQLLTRIGIHTGEVIVGNIGSSERMNYTILGDSVNLAARLEGTNKLYGTNIIVSDATVKRLHDHAVVRPLDIVAVKGKQEGVAIYELVALKNSDPLVLPSDNQVKFCGEFTKGFRYYLEQRWDEAINIFQNLQLDYGRDVPCEMYIKRCEEYKKAPPPSNWDGVYHLKSK